MQKISDPPPADDAPSSGWTSCRSAAHRARSAVSIGPPSAPPPEAAGWSHPDPQERHQGPRDLQPQRKGLGLEVIFLQPIPASWITRTYTPDQITAWRYYPESHSDGRKTCGCSYCLRGQIKNRKLREAYGPE